MNAVWRSLAATAGGLALFALARSWERNSRSFAGQVVVITGGSRGLGLEMARRWCREGARVALCARTAEDVEEAVNELRAHGGEVFGQACDVTQPDQVQAFIDGVLAQWGRIDVLVNNAGIIQVGPMDCMTPADYEHALATHFWGPFHMTQAALPAMRRQRAGRIVNISSIGGRVDMPHLLPYVTSKFALTGWSEGLAAELRQQGIIVTTVTPGLMRTGSPRRADFKGHHRAEYAWFSIGAGMPLVSIDSGLAARRIIEGCRRGDAAVMVSGFSAIASRCHGLMPGAMTSLLTAVNSVLPPAKGGTRRIHKGWQSESLVSPSILTTLNERAAVRNHEI